jgi:hypothetical protein
MRKRPERELYLIGANRIRASARFPDQSQEVVIRDQHHPEHFGSPLPARQGPLR